MALTVSLRDASGRLIPLGALQRGEIPTEVVVAVPGETAAGAHTITWRITGPDGHPVTGAIPLTIMGAGVVAADTMTRPDSSEAVTAGASFESGPSLPSTIVRWAVLLSMIAVIGAVAFAAAVVPRATRSLADARTWQSTASRVGAIAASISIVALACHLLLQWRQVNVDGSVGLLAIVSATAWGKALLLQIAAAALALAGFAFVSQSGPRIAVTAIAAVAMALGTSLSGHPAASATPALAVATDVVHIIGASSWIGALGCVMTVVWLGRRSGESEVQGVASLVSAFSPVALSGAAAVVLTGLVSAYLRVGTVPDWSSTYVRVLLLKLAVLAALWAFGAYNWLKVKPGLVTGGTTGHLKRSGSMELAVGALIVGITAALIGTPLPR